MSPFVMSLFGFGWYQRWGGECYQHEGEQPLFIFLCTLTTFIIYANNTLVYQYPGKVTCYLISCLFPVREMSLSKQKQPHMRILIKLHSVPVRSSKEMIGQHFSCLPALEVSRQSHRHFTLPEKFPVLWFGYCDIISRFKLKCVYSSSSCSLDSWAGSLSVSTLHVLAVSVLPGNPPGWSNSPKTSAGFLAILYCRYVCANGCLSLC